MSEPTKLSFTQRERIFNKVVQTVQKNYFDPKFNGVDWPRIAQERRSSILGLEDPAAFELAVHDLVRCLKTSHTGFFHQSVRRVPGRLALAATFSKREPNGLPQWMAQDVHEGGPGERAGLRPGDVLVKINDKPIAPPEQPMFPMGADATLAVNRLGNDILIPVSIPVPRSRKQPYSEPKPVIHSVLDGSIGYLKVSILPGMLGLNVAREIDSATEALADCDGLILDLRGHLGGGLGVLRLMSHLTPDKLPIGFTATRKRIEQGYTKADLKRLDRLPTHLPNPLAIASLAIQFAGRDPFILLVSEGLGPKKWHGRVAILVNEHTVSAGEMVAAFAQENRLATIVGTETAGRLIPGSGFKVDGGYMLIIPKAEYITWAGHRFEGRGIYPDLAVQSDSIVDPGSDVHVQRASELFSTRTH